MANIRDRLPVHPIRMMPDRAYLDHPVCQPQCHLRLSSFREEMTLHVEGDGLIVG